MGKLEEKLELEQSLVDQFVRQAEKEYPYEACGFLIGNYENGKVNATEYLLQENVMSENKERRFLINTKDYLKAEMYADKTGQSLIGIVHSHPDHPDLPSDFDRDHAWPGFSYIIISVREQKAVSFKSWRLKEDRSGFEQEKISVN